MSSRGSIQGLVLAILLASAPLLALQHPGDGAPAAAPPPPQGPAAAPPEEFTPDASPVPANSLVFWEENLGQWETDDPWVLRGHPVSLGSDGLHLHGEDGSITLRVGAPGPIEVVAGRVGTTSVFDTEDSYVGARQADRLRIPDAWPGIHFDVYTTSDGQLEFDLVIAPGADPSLARLAVEGAVPGLVDGRLVLDDFSFDAPHAYQDTENGRTVVSSAFVVAGRHVLFQVGAYDASIALVIDPVLVYGTILDATTDAAYDFAVTDEAFYLAGYLSPATSYGRITASHAASSPSSIGAFFAHFDRNDGSLVALVVLAGTSTVIGFGMDVTSDGSVLLSGRTLGDLPLRNAPSWSVRQGPSDGYVARFPYDPMTRAYDLDFLSYFGSSDDFTPYYDAAYDVIANPDGSFWLGGLVMGKDGIPPAPSGTITAESAKTYYNVFGALFAAGATPTLAARTVFGGGFANYVGAGAFDVDAQGNLYVFGAVDLRSWSPIMEGTPDALFVRPISSNSYDHFYAKLDRDASIKHLSYWGGRGAEHYQHLFMNVRSENEILVSGSISGCCIDMLTEPRPFPGGIGNYDIYVSHIDIARGDVIFSTQLGSSQADYAGGVDMLEGKYYVGGYSRGDQEPVNARPYALPKPGKNGAQDAFVTMIDPQRIDTAAAIDDQPGMVAYTMYVGSDQDSVLRRMGFDETGMLVLAGSSYGTVNDVPPVSQDAAVVARSGTGTNSFLQVYDMRLGPVLRAETDDIVRISPETELVTLSMTEVRVSVDADDPGWTVPASQLRWDLDGDGAFDDAVGEGPFAIYEPMKASRTVCVDSVDPAPSAPPATKCMDIIWENRLPSAQLVLLSEPDGTAADLPRFYRGEDIWIDGSNSKDPDGTILFDDAEWTHLPGPVLIGGAQSLVTRNVYDETGVKSVRLDITDDDGAPATATIEFVVTSRAPSLECTLGAARVGRWVDVDVDARDADGFIASWVFAPGSGMENVTGVGAPPVHIRAPDFFSADQEGTSGTAVLILTDNDGDEARCEMPYTVGPAALTADYVVTGSGSELHFRDASLPTPGRTVVAWQWFVDGALVSDAPAFDATLSQGTHRIRLVATDGVATDAYEGLVHVTSITGGPQAAIDLSEGPYAAGMPIQFFDVSTAGAAPIVERTWTFRDGTAHEERPIRFLDEGDHLIRLRVTDEMGGTSTAEQYLHVAAPERIIPSFSASTVTPFVGQEVLFLDDSRTAGFGILDREWDFGDGSPAQQGTSARHSFDEGTHVVTLTLTDSAGDRHAVSHTVTARPAPETPTVEPIRPGLPVAEAGPDRVAAPGSIVRLEASGAKQDATWRWEQTGGPRTLILDEDTPRPSIAIPYVDGEIVLELAVTSAAGTSTDSVRITIGDRADGLGAIAPPDARFTTQQAGLTVHLVAPEHTLDATYAWDLGDGATAAGREVAHVYPDHGEYEVRLLVTDDHGREGFHYERLDLRAGGDADMQRIQGEEARIMGVPPATFGVAAGLVFVTLVACGAYILIRRR